MGDIEQVDPPLPPRSGLCPEVGKRRVWKFFPTLEIPPQWGLGYAQRWEKEGSGNSFPERVLGVLP